MKHMVLAVEDRIVDGEHAIILVGAEETECNVPLSVLPGGMREGMWLQVRFDGDALASVELDRRATKEAERRIAPKMDLLRQHGRTKP